MNRATIAFLAILLTAAGAGLIWIGVRAGQRNAWGSTAEIDKNSDKQPFVGSKITEFTLTDQSGKTYSSKELAGKVWVANFFYATCPTTCTEQNRRIRILQTDYASRGLEAVSITCDPSQDTPSTLATYSKQFDANPKTWHFLTWRDFDYIKQIANDYFSLPLARMSHSDQVVLLKRDGTVHGVYTLTNPVSFAELIDNIEKLLDDGTTSI